MKLRFNEAVRMNRVCHTVNKVPVAVALGGRCRLLLFSSHNGLHAKVERSPSALNTSFEVVASSKKRLKYKGMCHRGDKIGVNPL